ncbi:hypothetical protein SAMN05443428_1543 [Caloramator quimbayensis]|uniref:Uncharacterized protein n=1 Tax=Caloramator quimbayensis TaxID=1147123 RepID=A0A1T4YH89_9CLOT|nr:hypothetical protein [Caloramator quimbayensis]SKB01154.1 hypothetical protein SAMN05443428_1543 [Caloramator quimbayensis]
MSKILKIEGNCDLMISRYGDLYINSKGIEKIITDNLPELKEYKNYPAEISITINIHNNEELNITTEGYKANKQDKEEIEGGNE